MAKQQQEKFTINLHISYGSDFQKEVLSNLPELFMVALKMGAEKNHKKNHVQYYITKDLVGKKTESETK